MRMRSMPLAASASLMYAIAAPAASAHHAFSSEVSRDLPLGLTGTVARVERMHPHARFYIEARGENGEMVEWDFELAGPNSLMRQGWRHDSLKAGDTVTVT